LKKPGTKILQTPLKNGLEKTTKIGFYHWLHGARHSGKTSINRLLAKQDHLTKPQKKAPALKLGQAK
jgi:hypothetical protein